MIVAIGLLSLLVIGIPLVRWLHGDQSAGLLAGEAFLIGCGWCSVVMLGLSITGAPWSPLVITTAMLLPSIAAWIVTQPSTTPAAILREKAESDTAGSFPNPRREIHARSALIAVGFDAVSVVLLIARIRFSTIASIWQVDFWAIWGLKARQFFEYGGIDWAFLQNPDNTFLHPDYPILMPMLFDFFAVLGRGWDDRWIGLLYPAFAIALAAIVRTLIRSELDSRVAASVATLGIVGIAANPLVVLADGPLIAFGTAGVLLVRRGWRTAHRSDIEALTSGASTLQTRSDVWTGSVLLGFAAFTKNEGMVLILAILIAAFLTMSGNRRRILELWPAFVLPAGWKLVAIALGLRWDYERSDIVHLTFDRLRDPAPIVAALLANAGYRLFWLAVAGMLLLGFRRILDRDMFLLVTASVLLTFYVAAYFASPNEPVWHVTTSWQRILLHPAVLFLYLGIAALTPIAEDG